MTFLSLIFKNIFRSKIRTLLTVIGISLGIATIVVFGLVTSGFEDLAGDLLKPGEIDFSVAKAGSADVILSFLSDNQVSSIEQLEGVEAVSPILFSLVATEKFPYFIALGIDRDKLDLNGIRIIEGNAFDSDNEIIIGKITAENYDLEPGDSLEINDTPHKIVGIYESGVNFQDGGAVTSVAKGQELQNIEDQVNIIGVKVRSGFDAKEIAKQVEDLDEDFVSIQDAGDFEAIDNGTEIFKSISWAISLLAILIGSFGVMNTIIMSVYERTREIGILRALGWKRWRIVWMVMSEAVLIGFIASIAGIGIGIGLSLLLQQTDLGESWLVVRYEPITFVQAISISLMVVLFGAIYPSFKASQMQPTEALRYE